MRFFLIFFFVIVFYGCKNSSSTVQDEPFYQEQWAIHYDKAFYDAYAVDQDAHIYGENTMSKYTGRGVKIAIIDIGLDTDHVEYRNNIVKAINSADGSDNVACVNSSACFHGNAVTGVIASNINNKGLRGIAPDAQIIFIKLDLAGYVGDDEILDALNYAEQEDVDIINNSWGTGAISPVIQEKIDEMATNGRDGKGIIFIFASGNDGQENSNDESMIESVIGVGSSDEENLRAIYSDFGEGLDIVAPGGYSLGITTTYLSADTNHPSDYMRAEDYTKFQGTSASAPIVSGAIALLLEKSPSLSRLQVQQLLQTSSDKIGNIEYIDGKNLYYGYGKLNLDTLVN